MLTRHLATIFRIPHLLPKTFSTPIIKTQLSTFSSSKKIKQLQKQLKSKKKKSPPPTPTSQIENETQQYQQLKKSINKIKKQTQDLQVTSQCQIENEIIVDEIKRQRVQLENQDAVKDSEENVEELPIFRFGEKFLIGLSGVNVALASILSLPVISNNCYWLGMYSSCFLYPSLLFTTCAAIGINLAYLIARQGLALDTPSSQLKKVDITKAPLSFYLEMTLLSLQVFSLAISVSIPLTLIGLQPNLRNIGLYSILFFILTGNAHNTFQRKFFNNVNYKISTPSTCFIVLFLLSSFLHVTYSLSQIKSKQEVKRAEKFQEGQKRIKNMWKIEKIVIENTKITDILQTQPQKNPQNHTENTPNTTQSAETSNNPSQQPPKTNKIW